MVIIGIFRTSVWWSVTSACVKNSLFVWFFSSLVVIHLNVFYAAKQPFKGSHGIFPKRKKMYTHKHYMCRVGFFINFNKYSIIFISTLFSTMNCVFYATACSQHKYNRVIFYFHHQPFKQWITRIFSQKKNSSHLCWPHVNPSI